MAGSVFICGMDHDAGSSVVTLGLFGVLRRVVPSLGFFKPVGSGPKDDIDCAVIKNAYQLDRDTSELVALPIDEARELVAREREDALFERIEERYARLSEGREFMLLEGINNQRSLSVFDMDINESIASRLGAPVLLVARGGAPAEAVVPEALVDAVRTTKRSFESRGAEVLGVVVNRVPGHAGDAHAKRLAEAFHDAGISLYGVIPNLDYLGRPKLDQIASELGARVIRGGDQLQTVAADTIIAAMQPRHFVRHLKRDRTLVITPGDREDILLTIACAQSSMRRGSVAGVMLTGGLEPDAGLLELIEEMNLPALPLLSVESDTYRTAERVARVETRIRPGDRDKINSAAMAVATHVEHERLWESLEMPRPARRKIGPEAFLERLVEKARAANKRIVLPEGDEPRTLRAVEKIYKLEMCPLVLLGSEDRIHAVAKAEGVKLPDAVEIVDPRNAPDFERWAEAVVEARRGKRGGMTVDVARQWLLDTRINCGTVMVKCGNADGLVAGAVHSTGDTIRPALQIIRVDPAFGVASSVFFMALKERVLVYGDCAIIPNPNAQELASIAISSARTARALGIEPRVAMLSYSTGKSGAGESVDKVTEATKLVRDQMPDFAIDGPLQYDAAIDPDVGRLKQPDSPVAGRANVFVFPDLDAGNIAYKAVQRSTGALAVGPVIQGLFKPVNDLSRGCSVDDIVYTIAVTAVQAGTH